MTDVIHFIVKRALYHEIVCTAERSSEYSSREKSRNRNRVSCHECLKWMRGHPDMKPKGMTFSFSDGPLPI